jgi:2-polyprenyl-3-methyl-5-hydroxy-6-metoxy-1,4-benzoquinol methylase
MQQRHIDRQQYFNEQRESVERYILPYIRDGLRLLVEIGSAFRVLEVGCGEGGNLAPFLARGCTCWGVELSHERVQDALKFYAQNPLRSNLHLINKSIYDVSPKELGGTFQLILLKDVIEHIPAQERLLERLRTLLAPSGLLFLSFPPWRMPFGGHQQAVGSRWVNRMPYIHIVPKALYRMILKLFGVTKPEVDSLMELTQTRLSIRRFEKIVRTQKWEMVKKTQGFVNPNYHINFGLKPRRVPLFLRIPYLQDFYTTALYCLLH